LNVSPGFIHPWLALSTAAGCELRRLSNSRID